MRALVELGDVFRACVRQKQAMGIPPGPARNVCADSEPGDFQWPGIFFRSADEERDALLNDLPRWGARNLVPGFVPSGVDPRTEAHLWVKELQRAGQDPPLQKSAWMEHAKRRGLSDDQAEEGWQSITATFGESLQELDSRYGGFYGAMPHALRVRMRGDSAGWPWKTKEAEAVYDAAVKHISKHPDIPLETAFQAGLQATGLSPADLTPEDHAIMSMALTWKLQGKEVTPEPPPVPVARSSYGLKAGAS